MMRLVYNCNSSHRSIGLKRIAGTYRDRKYSCKVQRPLTGQLDDGTLGAGLVMTGLHVASRHSETIQ